MRPILYLIKTPDKKRVDRYRISFLKREDIEEICVCIWERKFKTQTRSHPLLAIDLIDSDYHGIHNGGNIAPRRSSKSSKWRRARTPSLRRRWCQWLSTM